MINIRLMNYDAVDICRIFSGAGVVGFFLFIFYF